MWPQILGWTATSIFACSYFFTRAAALRAIQATAAMLWIVYGMQIHSAPVVVSNAMVGVAAVYTSLRQMRQRRCPPVAALGQQPAEPSSAGRNG
jgi:hypothetical protein